MFLSVSLIFLSLPVLNIAGVLDFCLLFLVIVSQQWEEVRNFFKKNLTSGSWEFKSACQTPPFSSTLTSTHPASSHKEKTNYTVCLCDVKKGVSCLSMSHAETFIVAGKKLQPSHLKPVFSPKPFCSIFLKFDAALRKSFLFYFLKLQLKSQCFCEKTRIKNTEKLKDLEENLFLLCSVTSSLFFLSIWKHLKLQLWLHDALCSAATSASNFRKEKFLFFSVLIDG